MQKPTPHTATQQSARFVPFSGSLHNAQISEALLKALHSRVGGSLAQQIAEAYATLAQAGHEHKAEAILTKIVEPGPIFITATRPSSTALSGDERLITETEHIPEQEKWSLSIRAWAQCVEHGPEIAFTTLPFLLSLDCVFFLGQQWVRELIARYHQQGDKEKIKRLFFGIGKCGVNSWKRTLEDFRRDLKIKTEVDRLLKEGRSQREAFRLVGKQRALSPQAIEKIYYKRTSGYDPLAHLLAVA